jgi:acyl dehydratase
MGVTTSYLRGLLPRPGAATAPTTMVRRDGVRIDPAHLLRYARVCGFTLTGPLPPSYPHLLGFAPALALMAGRDFPFRLPGLVHTRQVLTWYRPIEVDEVLDVEVSAANLAAHHRGATIDVLTRVRSGGDEVWLGRSTYLSRSVQLPSPADAPAAPGAEPLPAAAWGRLPAGLGRRYAAVSGDRNPIHLSGVTARPFGFRTAIAHGMWSAARCLAALGGRLPERGEATVSFARPVPLPGRVGFGAGFEGDAVAFTLADPAGRTLVVGNVGPGRR